VVRRAVSEALGRGPAPELHLDIQGAAVPHAVTLALPGILAGASSGRWSSLTEVFARAPEAAAGVLPAAEQAVAVGTPVRDPTESIPLMLPLGQFRDTFIVAVDPEGIAIIDQHVAHERVLFEQVMERLTAGQLESQRLLQPLIIELSPGQLHTLKMHAGTLERLGFDLQDFGGTSLRIAAIPAIVGLEQSVAAVKALAEDLEGIDRGSPVDDALRKVAATTACHAAVKANCPLTAEKMQYILDELRRTAHSSICPHGRPVVLRITRREIERNFQRI
jgi:DNA mismatch repair protein MutL